MLASVVFFPVHLSVSELHSYKEYGLVIKMLDFTLNEHCLKEKKIKYTGEKWSGNCCILCLQKEEKMFSVIIVKW